MRCVEDDKAGFLSTVIQLRKDSVKWVRSVTSFNNTLQYHSIPMISDTSCLMEGISPRKYTLAGNGFAPPPYSSLIVGQPDGRPKSR